jgi:VCBS repeat-containing protein
VAITVNFVNTPPVANGQSVTTAEDTPKAITLTGSDLDNDSLTFVILAAPTNGTLSGFNTNTGAVTYAPNTNFNGGDSFTFRVNDGQTNSGVATVAITVSPVNDAPVANSQSVTTPEDTPKAITLTGSDVENDPLTFAIVIGPTNGTLSSFNTNTGSITYTPNTNFNGPDSFTFRVNDGQTNSTLATVAITVSPVNDAPVANNQNVNTPQNTPHAITLTGSDVENDPLTFAIVTSPTNGALTGFNPNTGAVTYTPNTNFSGADTFTFRVNDGQTNSAVATVAITVNFVNTQPVANGQSVTTAEDTPKAITLTGSDGENDPLTFAIVTGPTNGTLSGLNPNTGVVTYTPSTNFYGGDSFTFQVNDGQTNSAPATVVLTVTPVNDAPVANAQSVTTLEDTPKAIVLTASDVENDPLTFAIVTGPTNGILSGLNPNTGAVTYTPNTNFNGSDSFTFRVNDGQTNSSAATVAITVTPVNDAPIANGQSVTTAEDTPKAITLTGIDVENNPLTFSIVTGPTNGTLSGLSPNTGAVTYIPSTNFNGSDSFTFRVNDGLSNSSPASVNITVTPVNDPPVVASDSYGLNKNSTLPVSAPGVLANDTDVDNDPLTAIKVTNPLHGTLSLNANGGFVYTPVSNYFGSDSFTYRATDGTATSAVATVSLTITNINSSPVAVDDTFIDSQNVVLTLPFTALLTNDYDPDGDTLSITLINTNSSQSGKITSTTTNFTYIPPTNYVGTDTFLYVIGDGHGGSGTGTVSIVLSLAQFAVHAGSPIFNPQTGLFEESVTVTNIGSTTAAAVRLLVTNINSTNGVPRTNVYLYNATGTNSGVPYVQYNAPLNPGQTVNFLLEFFVADRRPFTNSFIAQEVLPSPTGTNAASGVPIDREFVDLRIPGSPRFVIEFTSIPGRTYTILYSPSLGNWKAATPSITANATKTQWYDDGPPKTDSQPLSTTNRFYRVLVAPSNP